MFGLLPPPIRNGLLLSAFRLPRLPGAVTAVTITTIQFDHIDCTVPFASFTCTANATWSPGSSDSDAEFGLGQELPVGDTHCTLSKTPSFSDAAPVVEQLSNNAY
ncbi:MAG: hypothetical protein H0W08_18605 [Acidobacteria bacterium]|nr:hypothetical protein [Acidobacteriota bacterium]